MNKLLKCEAFNTYYQYWKFKITIMCYKNIIFVYSIKFIII